MSEREIPFPNLTPEHTEIYTGQLALVKRWGNALTQPDIPDTDLEHTQSLIELDYEIMERYPNLNGALDWTSQTGILAMHYVHDAGEILMDDLALSDPDYSRKKPKKTRMEAIAFTIMVIENIKDPKLGEALLTAYRRYSRNRMDDKEAIFANLLNTVEGIRYGLKHKAYDNPEESLSKRSQHVSIAMGKLVEYAEPLSRLLEGESREELLDFLCRELDGFRRAGFTRLADASLQTLKLSST